MSRNGSTSFSRSSASSSRVGPSEGLTAIGSKEGPNACRSCTDGVVQAPAPDRLIPGGLPSEALVAHVLVSKYADHLPLYRQAQIYARQDIDLDRSTLADWVGRAAFELRPVFDALIADLKRSTKLFMEFEGTVALMGPRKPRRTRVPRCSIRGPGKPKPDTSGRWPATTALGAARRRLGWPSPKHRAVAGNMPSVYCPI